MQGKSFEIMQGDITTLPVDAIVNAAKSSLLGGGGVDGAVHRAAGPQLLEECKTLGGCPTGDARITGAYNLPCRYVIHAVGPRVMGYEPTEDDKLLLKNAYLNSLLLAERRRCATVAFSAISCGHFSFDPKLAAPIAIQEIQRFLKSPDTHYVQKVIMVCYDSYTKDIFDQAFIAFNSDPIQPASQPDSDFLSYKELRFLDRLTESPNFEFPCKFYLDVFNEDIHDERISFNDPLYVLRKICSNFNDELIHDLLIMRYRERKTAFIQRHPSSLKFKLWNIYERAYSVIFQKSVIRHTVKEMLDTQMVNQGK